MKKIAIIGAGFAGLAAAWEAVKSGYKVDIFEAEKLPGGLASGLKNDKWLWSLEHHYHHIFQTDKDILNLLSEMNLNKKIFFKTVNTRSYFDKRAWSVDSPINLLRFSPLSFFDRLRVGFVIAFLKFLPNGRWLEKYSAKDFLIKTMGKAGWEILWQPLFDGKFGKQAGKINMAWFWARISSRSQQLGYYQGGFLCLAEDMVEVLKSKGVKFHFSAPVLKIKSSNKKINVILEKNKSLPFDNVLITLPSPVASKLVDLPKNNLKGLSARTLVLELDKEFFIDQTYWLSIHEKNWPFLAVVEHTNLTNKKNYGNKTIIYVGKYLDKKESFYKLSKEEILKIYQPFLEKLSPGFNKYLKRSWIFDADFAQPLVFTNHSKEVPLIKTDMNGVYWVSMQHVYPWDCGINYAVKFGLEAVKYFND